MLDGGLEVIDQRGTSHAAIQVTKRNFLAHFHLETVWFVAWNRFFVT